MYQSPISVDEDKQCYECKNYEYDSIYNMSYCLLGYGHGEWSLVDAEGSCESWTKG